MRYSFPIGIGLCAVAQIMNTMDAALGPRRGPAATGAAYADAAAGKERAGPALNGTG